MSRLRRAHPSPRRLSAALALLGLVAGLAFLFVPVDAAFANDPLLRFQPFSPGLATAGTRVDCGAPLANLARRAEGLSIYELARTDACRSAASRRAATAVAAAAVIGLLGLIGLAGSRDVSPAVG
jgi:hypothetical protein